MLARAALVPKQRGLTPILATARLKDYADMLTLEGDSLSHAAYIMCCKIAVLAALRVVPANERLEIVLERQDRYGLLAAYEIERLSKSTEVPEVMLMEDGRLLSCPTGGSLRKGIRFYVGQPIVWLMRVFSTPATEIRSSAAGPTRSYRLIPELDSAGLSKEKRRGWL